MSKYYFNFDFKWDSEPLIEYFQRQKEHGRIIKEKKRFDVVDLTDYKYQLPLFKEMQMKCILNDCLLGEITEQIGAHCNPGNNGLVILPLSGGIDFDFYSAEPGSSFMPWDMTEEIRQTLCCQLQNVTTPIVFNGRLIHDYKPTTGSAVMYAVKIPLTYSWDKTRSLFDR